MTIPLQGRGPGAASLYPGCMREILLPPLRIAAILAFCTGLGLLLLNPPSFAGLEDLITIVVIGIAVALVTAWLTVLAIGGEMPEPEFRRLMDRSEKLAQLPVPDYPPSEFDELVMQALDDLPPDFQEVLDTVPVVVSQDGHKHGAYGLYMGGTVARESSFPDRIIIFQDTLEGSFGRDPDLLRSQVTRTVRHEVAHHLGWDEPGVRGLGL